MSSLDSRIRYMIAAFESIKPISSYEIQIHCNEAGYKAVSGLCRSVPQGPSPVELYGCKVKKVEFDESEPDVRVILAFPWSKEVTVG